MSIVACLRLRVPAGTHCMKNATPIAANSRVARSVCQNKSSAISTADQRLGRLGQAEKSRVGRPEVLEGFAKQALQHDSG